MKPFILFAIALFTASLCVAGEDAPSWVKEAASMAAPKYESKVPAVVLLSEQRISIDDSGKRVINSRKVVRVLTRDGRREAHAVEFYRGGTSKVKELHAWLVSSMGQASQLPKDRTVDISAAANDVYSDVRGRVIDADKEASPGTVFAYEAVTEDKSIFTQFSWSFQDRLPTLRSRFTLTMPDGWRAESVSFNSKKIEPVVSGTTQTWEMRDLPFIDPEPAGPAARALAPRIGVTFFPPRAVKNAGPSFATWQDVSMFQYGLAQDRQTESPEMTARTKQLIANAKSEFERIAAIAKFVQRINYIAIETNLGRGDGYRPHAAADVFAKSYGDCKDKANLMRTMLKIAGIESYLTAIYSGDRSFARPEWPSPYEFNHMIIAVKLTEPVDVASVLEHPSLGKLLFFDPTDDSIPPGYLPPHEQNSHALVIAAEKGELVKVPVTPPVQNRVEREAEVSVADNGTANIKLRERSFGETAAVIRHRQARATEDENRRSVEGWLARAASAPNVSKYEGAQAADGAYERTVEYSSPAFAQDMQGHLLLVKPSPAPFFSAYFSDPRRKHPVLLESHSQSETVRVVAPSGYQVDEVPQGVKFETPFGKFTSAYSEELGSVMVKRTLEIRASTVPVENYTELRDFFSHVLGSVQAPVVFVKK